jgi:hypothetical protein
MQLLDALEARLTQRADQQHMPPEFLEQFAARFEDEGLPELVHSWGGCCQRDSKGPCSTLMIHIGHGPHIQPLISLQLGWSHGRSPPAVEVVVELLPCVRLVLRDVICAGDLT